MHIVIVYNERPSGYDRNDPALEKHIEGDEPRTIHAIGKAVLTNGHTVKYFPVQENLYEKLKKHKSTIDLILNLSEGFAKGSDREAHLPMIAEILGIPYTGPGPLSSTLILNKSRAKEIWRANGVRTTNSQLFTAVNTPLKSTLTYPLMVKPNGEGSGIVIKSNSITKSDEELSLSISTILTDYNQPALVETYLPGREFTVAIVGNGDNLITLPIIEINFSSFPSGAPPIDSYEAKFIYGATGQVDMHSTEMCPAQIPQSLESEINELAKSAYQTIGCQDFGRVDIRLDSNNIPHVLEINHPPGLMSDEFESSFFVIAARKYGWSFDELIGQILNSASSRLKI